MFELSLAAYACDPGASRGRRHPESEPEHRTPFQRDRDRIIHSNAFRRLKHKTQVFVYHEGDYFRTRLTHSIEVAQLARTISRTLALCEDLAEAVALAHDLGHTPFGHAGERALDAVMRPWGGFDHNVQTMRILTRLERRYADFDGLNLTWETLEGVVKHNGPVTTRPLPSTLAEHDAQQPLWLETWPSAEAQVAALADDIAYNNHDFDDGLRAGLFSLDDVRDLPLIGELLAEVEARHPGLDRQRTIYETIRRMIDRMVSDLVFESRRLLAEAAPDSADAVRRAGQPLISFSPSMRESIAGLQRFLMARMYRHYKVNRVMSKAQRMVRELFGQLHAEPDSLPPEWYAETDGPKTARTARVVADYIAGMTDRYAMLEHQRLFDRFAST